MPILEESWQPIAETLGFANELEMLKTLYEQEGYSIKEISKVLGYAYWSVRRRLIMNNIDMRSRGGPNKGGHRILGKVSDEELFGTGYSILAQKYNVHHTTVFSERKYRNVCNSAQLAQSDGSSNSVG